MFWELGYEASDTETLSRRTGLTKPSLYNAFGSEEDLFVAAINRYRRTRSKASFDALTRASTPREGIRDYFLNLAQNVAGRGHPSGCLILSFAMPLCDRLPKVAAVLDSMPKESNARMTAYFDSAGGRAKLSFCILRVLIPKIAVSGAYIALFCPKMSDIGTLPFFKLKRFS